jgi:nitrous oxidase accessory protein
VKSRLAVALCGALLAVGDPAGLREAGGHSPPVAPDRGASAPDAPPPGASFAEDFDELARMTSDPSGPRDVWLRGKVYVGDLAIQRAVAIHGQAGTVLEGTGEGTVLTIHADDVSLDHVAVRRSGRRGTTEDAGIKATGNRVRVADVQVSDTLFGVSLLDCHHCALERLRVDGPEERADMRGDGIKLWEAHDSVIRGCTLDRVRDIVVWYTRGALVEDNVVRRSRYGTHFMYAHDAIARRNRVEDNVVGIFVMYSLRLDLEDNVLAGARGAAGMGLGFKESDGIRARRNWLVANTTGIYLDFTPRTPDRPAVFEDNVLALNDVALRMHSVEKGAAFRRNDFHANGETIEVDGGDDALGCEVAGNHFDDYEGYDLNGDGVGDVPHRVVSLSGELAEAHPALKFFSGTTAMQLVDAAARALPVLASHTLLVDSAPAMRAPTRREP